MDLRLLPEGSGSKGPCPGWEGLIAIHPAIPHSRGDALGLGRWEAAADRLLSRADEAQLNPGRGPSVARVWRRRGQWAQRWLYVSEPPSWLVGGVSWEHPPPGLLDEEAVSTMIVQKSVVVVATPGHQSVRAERWVRRGWCHLQMWAAWQTSGRRCTSLRTGVREVHILGGVTGAYGPAVRAILPHTHMLFPVFQEVWALLADGVRHIQQGQLGLEESWANWVEGGAETRKQDPYFRFPGSPDASGWNEGSSSLHYTHVVAL